MPEESPVDNPPSSSPYVRALPVPHSGAAPSAQRPWKPRIPEIIKDLQLLTTPYVSRADIEGKLDLRRSQADAVMRQVGFKPASELGLPGKLNLVSVSELIAWLDVHYDAGARKEHDRLEALQKKLAAAADEQRLKKTQTVFRDRDQVKKILRGDIENIPGVTLEPPAEGRPGRFTILFVSTEDFLGKVHLFGWSAVNQEEKLHQMTSPICKPKP
jgi:hypothetical protein